MISAQTASVSSPNITIPHADYQALQAQVQSLTAQLEWCKRQLFGSQSEKRLKLDPAIQTDLLAALGELPVRKSLATETITCQRRKGTSRSDDCVTDKGPRFDETVPVGGIEVSAPELSGSKSNQFITIDTRISRRLAQRPDSYMVLEYRRPVLKHLPTQTRKTPRAPRAIFEGSMDETPRKAGKKKGKGKLNQIWYWPLYGEDDGVCFTYSQSRGRQHVDTLLTDGYAAYGRFAAHRPEVVRAQCWVHTRRAFERAEHSEPGAVAKALDIIGTLYQLEAEIRKRKLGDQAKQDYRARHSMAVVDAFFGWLHEQRNCLDLVTIDPFSKALTYATEREASLKIFLGDPDVPIDTNHLARALRVIPVGRRNWLFNWTEFGARHVGISQSLLATCRLQDVDPYACLVDVLQRVSLHPAHDVEDLTPRQWKALFADNPLKSDLAGLGK